jgi:hypothetical protein
LYTMEQLGFPKKHSPAAVGTVKQTNAHVQTGSLGKPELGGS